MNGELVHPLALVLLAVPAVLAVLLWLRRRRSRPSLRWPTLDPLLGARRGLRARTRGIPTALRVLALVVLVVALARPRGGEVHETVTTEGVDIMFVLDTSQSMLAEDMVGKEGRLNRVEAAKDVVADFVGRRTADRMGLISFDEVAVPRCPPTLDYGVLLDFLTEVRTDERGGGTAIGTALASAVNRLRTSTAKSRVVVLITDGRSNAGKIAPLDAAQLALLTGVKVYTIGVGTKGMADFPVKTPFGQTVYQKVASDIDETTLRAIARETGGEYFRATDKAQLDMIFERVDELEKTKIEVERHVTYREVFPLLVRSAAGLVGFALLAAATLWRSFP